jgi:hypothetical protein
LVEGTVTERVVRLKKVPKQIRRAVSGPVRFAVDRETWERFDCSGS